MNMTNLLDDGEKTQSLAASSSSSAITKHDDVMKVPDGGLVAWVQCFSAFLAFFSGWGIINSFGKTGSLIVCFFPPLYSNTDI